jgi:chromosome partitioning protein
MSAKVITVFNQKGGVGKTAVSMHLGGTLALRGWKTLVIDCDSQGTAVRWAGKAVDETYYLATVCNLADAGKGLHREIKKFIEDYDFIVVDCPPAIESPAPAAALMVSDLALIPLVPAPSDMWASERAKNLVRDAWVFNETLKARTVINMFQPKSPVAQDAAALMAEDAEIPPLETKLQLRSPFRDCLIDGTTAHRMRNGQAAVREIEALCDEVLAVMDMPKSPVKSGKGRAK